MKTSYSSLKRRRNSRRKQLSKYHESRICNLKPQEIKEMYDFHSRQLTSKYREATIRTHAEKYVYDWFLKYSKNKVYRSIWVGNRNFDFLLPTIAGLPDNNKGTSQRLIQGLVIEIDGDIHNHEFKQRKDEQKAELINELRLGLYTINNEDIHTKVVPFIKSLSGLPRLDSRATKRVFNRIYVETLLWQADSVELYNLFEINFSK